MVSFHFEIECKLLTNACKDPHLSLPPPIPCLNLYLYLHILSLDLPKALMSLGICSSQLKCSFPRSLPGCFLFNMQV